MNLATPTLYGEPLSGTPITALSIIKKPLVIFRFLAMIFAIIVFASISSGAWNMFGVCIINRTNSICNFTVALGVVSMLIAFIFLIIDIVFVTISSASSRRAIVITDMFLANTCLLCWLICTIVLIVGWWATDLTYMFVRTYQYQLIQVAVAFSILGIALWGVISFFSANRFQKGKQELMEFSSNINRAVNHNFDTLPGGLQGTVSGSSVNPPLYEESLSSTQTGIPQAKYVANNEGNSRINVLY